MLGSRFPFAIAVGDQALMPRMEVEQSPEGEFPREADAGRVDMSRTEREITIAGRIEVRKDIAYRLVQPLTLPP